VAQRCMQFLLEFVITNHVHGGTKLSQSWRGLVAYNLVRSLYTWRLTSWALSYHTVIRVSSHFATRATAAIIWRAKPLLESAAIAAKAVHWMSCIVAGVGRQSCAITEASARAKPSGDRLAQTPLAAVPSPPGKTSALALLSSSRPLLRRTMAGLAIKKAPEFSDTQRERDLEKSVSQGHQAQGRRVK
jgi:hypothetical protein